jgi:hypothetical protein
MSAKPQAGWKSALEELFHKHYKRGDTRVEFGAEELNAAAHKHKVRNQYDIVYNSRIRAKSVPLSVQDKCPKGFKWVIETLKKGDYAFVTIPESELVGFDPNPQMIEIKVLDATPEIIAKYAKNDEQAALALVRYNRLIDIFTGITAYSLQSHLKAEVKGMAQVEIDELYLGVDSAGRHYAIPVEAKSGNDALNGLQIKQAVILCSKLFPDLIARPIGIKITKREQKHGANVIAMMEFELAANGRLGLRSEKHYRLVGKDQLSEAEMKAQNQAPPEPRI